MKNLVHITPFDRFALPEIKKANDDEAASRAVEYGVPEPEAEESRWITVRGKAVLLNTKTGEIYRGGSGVRDPKTGEKVKKMTRGGPKQ